MIICPKCKIENDAARVECWVCTTVLCNDAKIVYLERALRMAREGSRFCEDKGLAEYFSLAVREIKETIKKSKP